MLNRETFLIIIIWLLLILTACTAASESWTSYTTEDGLVNNAITDIAVAEDGTIWVATRGGLSHFDDGVWHSYVKNDGLADNNVTSLAFAANGDLWVGTGNGLSRYDGDTWQTYQTENDNGINSIAVAPNGDLWATTSQEAGKSIGISHFNGEKWSHLIDELDNYEKTYIQLTFDGEKWHSETMDTPPVLSYGSGHDIAITPEGIIWFSSEFSGVTRLDIAEQTMITYKITSPHLLHLIKEIKVTPDGTLYLGTSVGDGIIILEDGKWSGFTEDDGLVDDSVTALEVDDGTIWVGTPSGVSVYDGDEWHTYTTEDGLVDNQVTAITVDDEVWLGTKNHGVMRYER